MVTLLSVGEIFYWLEVGEAKGESSFWTASEGNGNQDHFVSGRTAGKEDFSA